MQLDELITIYRADHGLSQRQFAEICGLSNGYISMLEKRQNPSTGKPLVPSLSALKKLAGGMGISLTELFSRADDLPITLLPENTMNNHVELPNNIFPLPHAKQKPRLGTIACGEPILVEQNIEDYDKVPDWVECDFTLKCKGDSMIGARIFDGDIVCIRQQPEVENGEIAAVLIEDEATLKRVYIQEGRLTLMPENPAYQPLIYVGDELENVRILGKATYFISAVR